MPEYFTYYSPIGPLLIEAEDNLIRKISFHDREIETNGFNPELKEKISDQFDEYFTGNRFEFDLPLYSGGTEFQKKVWEKLISIPYGNQITYMDLALQLGDKNLVRAVGGANSRNPLAILVPCHRVIGNKNKLTGYAGGIWRKKWLLQHELIHVPDKSILF